MIDLGGRDPAAARALLDDMRAVADKRDEAALWEPWAKAATNLLDDLRGRDPAAARALLDDMRAVADKRDEAALWEPWAKAATNLMADLRGRDPAAARALLDDMRAVADKRDEPRCGRNGPKRPSISCTTFAGATRRPRAPFSTTCAPSPTSATSRAVGAMGQSGDQPHGRPWRARPGGRARPPRRHARRRRASATKPRCGSHGPKRPSISCSTLAGATRRPRAPFSTTCAPSPTSATSRAVGAMGQRGDQLMNDLGGRDPAAARALLDDMRAVAEKRAKTALRETRRSRLPTSWPTFAEAFRRPRAPSFDDMRAGADKRDEASLSKRWAKAALNLFR